MGIRGPEFHGTGNIQSIIQWYVDIGINPPEDKADSVTFEASLYNAHRKSLKQMKAWRGCGASEWTRVQWKAIHSAAFCGGQSL